KVRAQQIGIAASVRRTIEDGIDVLHYELRRGLLADLLGKATEKARRDVRQPADPVQPPLLWNHVKRKQGVDVIRADRLVRDDRVGDQGARLFLALAR